MIRRKTDKKNLTIDNLARIIQQEFTVSRRETGERFDKMDERFDKVDERFDKVDADVSYLFGSLNLIRQEIAEIKEKLDGVVYRHELEALRDRIAQIEKKLKFAR